MNKLFNFIVPFLLLVSLCLYLFNIDREYDFLNQLHLASELPFPNPLTAFNEVIDNFKSFGNIDFNMSSNWFANVGKILGQFFTTFWSILKSPVILVYDIVLDVYYGGKAVLIMLGLSY